ncbi:hypothetical protein TNCV_3155301 [Trichonephila clavipes]|nr:hypothetical protein TNCV_3155301 [Trichonephila clavipes]
MYSAFVAWGYSKKPSSRKSTREVGGREESWESPDHLQGVLPQNWGKLGQIVLSPIWCSKLLLTAGVYLTLCHDEFRGPRSDTVKQVALEATRKTCI